ncbi:MAG: SufD family Fe-S cluster assembly protein [Bacteriovoracaceae bacterium]|jgi:Fe-S cluster assembly protein SufD|nr:SufD family Fe-S cluster assembly protein [Bacteriovoracaceae bacterium]
MINEFLDNLPTTKVETWKYTSLKKHFEDYKVIDGSTDFEFLNLDGSKNDNCKIEKASFVTTAPSAGNIAGDSAFNLTNKATKTYKITINNKNRPVILKHKYNNGVSVNKFLIESNDNEIHLLNEFTNNDEKHALSFNQFETNANNNQSINITNLQKLNNKSLIFNNILAFSKENTHIDIVSVDLGSKLARTNVHSELNHSESTTSVHGLYATKGNTHTDTNSFIYHNAPRSYSSQLYKSVLDDSARGVFTGLIRVEKDAQAINSDQLNKNLLLTSKAKANSRPQLEIYADDVKCSHGSTTGQINDDEVFYFTSRGIKIERAKKILSKAFINDVLFKIKNQDIKNLLIKEVNDG